MTQGDSLLDDEEISFLLERANNQSACEILDPTDSDTTKITIRGDLDNISLGDIFQTLSISKMRGILKVFNPLETRLIYFEEGTVRLMNANRKGTRRIGQRLVRCGALTTAQLRQALLEQKVTEAPLGETLIDLGFLTDDELTAVLNNQLEEDLHNIFIWGSGSFEFYKNKPDDEQILAELGRTPGFEVNSILLEAARRRDEWSKILESIRSVHAIPVIPTNVEFPEMSGNKLVVCEAVDNFSTISDLAESTMLGLFNCSKAICDLKAEGLIELANPELTVELALDATTKQDTKRALQLCQNLRHNAPNLDHELCQKLSRVLEACREPRLSASILLDCSRNLKHTDHRLDIARRALNCDRHSIPVMEFIRHEMRVANRTTTPEYADILGRLCEAMSAEGRDEEALEIFGELEQLSADTMALASRKATLLQRAGREKEALDLLLDVRREQERIGDDKRLIKIYEQILKLNPGQKDVAKALRLIRLDKVQLRVRKTVIGGIVAVGLIACFLGWRWSVTKEAVDAASLKVRSLISIRDLQEARVALAQAEQELGEHKVWLTLRDEIAKTATEIKNENDAKIERGYLKTLNEVTDLLKEGKLEQALAEYRRLLQHKDAVVLVHRISKGQLHRVTRRLQELRDTLKKNIPDAPDRLQRFDSLVEGLRVLEEKGKIEQLSLALSVLVVVENATVKELWPADDLKNAQELAAEIQSIKQVVATRTHEYRELIKIKERNRAFDPVFQKARRAEDRHDFKEAQKLYSLLYDQFSDSPVLGPGFKEKKEKFGSIIEQLDLLEKAVAAAKFGDARDYYQHLKRSFPEYPWGLMVSLPVNVVTTPPGARILLNEKLQGQSPMTVRYRPDGENHIRIEFLGFRPEQRTVSGDEVEVLHVFLNRMPAWTIKTDGAIDRGAVDGPSGQVFIADRTGTVTGWSLRRKEKLWSFPTGDLSGLLTQPIVHGDQVIVASVDGKLRAIDRTSGQLLWSLPDLPCESRPTMHDSKLVMVSGDALVIVQTKPGQGKAVREIKRFDLGAGSRQDLMMYKTNVIVAQDDGNVRLLSPTSGQDKCTPMRLGSGLVCPPLRIGDTLVVSSDEGQVAGFRLSDGKEVWRQKGLGELQWGPASDGRLVFVAAQPTPSLRATIHSFNLASGKPGPTFTAQDDELWSTHPSMIHDKLVVGSRSGVFRVLHPQTLQLLYHVQGEGAASARPVLTSGGAALFSFLSGNTLVITGMNAEK